MQLEIGDEALALLRARFTAVEGSCEVWTDDEVVRRILIRGAMDYARSGGGDFDEAADVAAALRELLPAD